MTPLEKNIRFFIGSTIGNSQALHWINYKRKKKIKKLINKDSDICIEGFQRSGNSFFVMLFRKRNKDVKMSHHTHAAAQVMKATDLNIPTIVLVRKPKDAIASLIVWDEKLSIGVALKAWISFHKTVLRVKTKIQISTFEEVTNDPVETVRQINKRFKTSFKLPKFKEEQLNRIKAHVLKSHNRMSSPLPTAEKNKAKQKYSELIVNHNLFPEADRIYLEVINTRNKVE